MRALNTTIQKWATPEQALLAIKTLPLIPVKVSMTFFADGLDLPPAYNPHAGRHKRENGQRAFHDDCIKRNIAPYTSMTIKYDDKQDFAIESAIESYLPESRQVAIDGLLRGARVQNIHVTSDYVGETTIIPVIASRFLPMLLARGYQLHEAELWLKYQEGFDRHCEMDPCLGYGKKSLFLTHSKRLGEHREASLHHWFERI